MDVVGPVEGLCVALVLAVIIYPCEPHQNSGNEGKNVALRHMSDIIEPSRCANRKSRLKI